MISYSSGWAVSLIPIVETDTGEMGGRGSQQQAFVERTKKRVRRSLRSTDHGAKPIESNPAVMMGKPVIAVRASPSNWLSAGETVQILEAHGLTRDGILAALRCAAHTMRAGTGIDNDAVPEEASRGGALLVTADKDFGELVFRMGRIATGVVLVRLAGLSAVSKANTLAAAFASRGHELTSAFSVISPGRVRIRRRTVDSEREA